MSEAFVREVATLQNTPLGTLLLYSYAREYGRYSSQLGPTLPKVMPVLPMLYHAETVRVVAAMNLKGGLLRYLRNRGAPTLGLRHRMAAMADQTFEALSLGFATGLLDFDSESGVVSSRRSRGLPDISQDEELKQMVAATRRLGCWFSEVSLTEMCILLDLTF